MCKQTESISKLTGALVKVQSTMETASKDANNPYFKSKYTTLAGCWDVARKPLSDNGLAVIQTTTFDETGNSVIVETTLSHVSGEWIRGSLKMPLVKIDPQAVGSAITYARRYALSAMIGIVSEEDDDGESAMGRTQTQAKTAPQAQAKTAPVKEDDPKNKLIKIAYGSLINGLGIQKPDMLAYIKGATGNNNIHSWTDLTEDELKEVISVAKKDALEKGKEV